MSEPLRPITVYVALLDEGVDVWRPVPAAHIGDDVYRLSADPVPEEEQWAFEPGTVVRCEWRLLSDGETLVAVERVPPTV